MPNKFPPGQQSIEWNEIKNGKVISKIEAAASLLDSAIRMWFNKEEFPAVTVVAFSAYQIIDNLLKHRSSHSYGFFLAELYIKSEYQKVYVDRMKKAYNYFKHADRDSDDNLVYNPHILEFILFEAIVEYNELTHSPTRLHKIFYTFFTILHHECLQDIGKSLLATVKKEYGLDEITIRDKRTHMFENWPEGLIKSCHIINYWTGKCDKDFTSTTTILK